MGQQKKGGHQRKSEFLAYMHDEATRHETDFSSLHFEFQVEFNVLYSYVYVQLALLVY